MSNILDLIMVISLTTGLTFILGWSQETDAFVQTEDKQVVLTTGLTTRWIVIFLALSSFQAIQPAARQVDHSPLPVATQDWTPAAPSE